MFLGIVKNAALAKTVLPKEKTMEKVYGVEGMMCPHCEAHVKKAVEEIDGVVSCVASHNEAKISVSLSKEVPDESIQKAVTEAGYTFKGLQA